MGRGAADALTVGRISRALWFSGAVSNVLGIAVVTLYFIVVFPPQGEGLTVPNLIVLAVFLPGALFIADRRVTRFGRPVIEWIERGGVPGETERHRVLRLPAHVARVSIANWLLAVPLFGGLNLALTGDLQFGVEVATTIALGGLSTCAAVYLLSERGVRPFVAAALSRAPDTPEVTRLLGILPRLVIGWLLCSGIPLLGLAMLPVGRIPETTNDFGPPIWFLTGVSIAFGLIVMTLAARSVADPVRELRRGMDAVAEGRTDVQVAVDDGSEVGRLQSGFNAMVAGLAERERLRDLFGRQVGEHVAREALERGVDFAGQARTISALFVDVIGSTRLAGEAEPEEVVARLNDFFGIVVRVIEDHGGLVNKFEGDAALCVFGAPVAQDDHATRALAAARELRRCVDAAGGLDAAIGVSAGVAVAGHIGAESRFEYTVIGDPVNEASRLSEVAKGLDARLVASGRAVEAAGGEEASRWQPHGEEVLRGREEPTPLFVPLVSSSAAG